MLSQFKASIDRTSVVKIGGLNKNRHSFSCKKIICGGK
jgi:hypothetical protein